MLRPADMADAVITVITTPPGSHLVLVEAQPGAPKPEAWARHHAALTSRLHER